MGGVLSLHRCVQERAEESEETKHQTNQHIEEKKILALDKAAKNNVSLVFNALWWSTAVHTPQEVNDFNGRKRLVCSSYSTQLYTQHQATQGSWVTAFCEGVQPTSTSNKATALALEKRRQTCLTPSGGQLQYMQPKEFMTFKGWQHLFSSSYGTQLYTLL